MSNEHKTVEAERRICRRLVNELLKAGLVVSVDDGGEVVLEFSGNVYAIMKALFSTDSDQLFVYRPGAVGRRYVGSIKLVYGNGTSVISDYSCGERSAPMQPAITAAEELANKLDLLGYPG